MNNCCKETEKTHIVQCGTNIEKNIAIHKQAMNKYEAMEDNHISQEAMMINDMAIRPQHYRKGEIDLYESWYQTRPFDEFRAIMESVAERYMKRDKHNRVEDLDKAIYTLERLREYEVKER